ncbi:MAG TPA: AAA family ATPase [Candidatus Paceibacterota bacterium]|jgi:dephospho-CoA kinase|nr:AAA family ATPase [Candidatus Paceibacterota bacterium]
MKLVIGIVGPPLAGKETVADKLEELLRRDGYTVSRHRFSDILRETLTLWGIPHGRTNEQLLPQVMYAPDAFGEGALSRAVKNRLMKDTADVGILDGVRWLEDEKMLREFPAEGIRSVIIHVTASPDRRYARLKARDRHGESAQTREDFERHEKAKTEVEIPAIGSRADITVINEHEDIKNLHKEIEHAHRTRLKPMLS